MKFGVCGNLSRLPVIKAAGYDYIEMNFSTLALMSEEDFVKTREALAEAGMRAEAFNGFFKADVVLYGEGADLDAIAAYCETGFSRAAQLGGAVAVLGSGGARSIPEGMTREEAEEHNIIGGLGSAVAEVICENCPVPVVRVGVEDKYGHSGKVPALLEMYGLTPANIVAKAKAAIALKK